MDRALRYRRANLVCAVIFAVLVPKSAEARASFEPRPREAAPYLASFLTAPTSSSPFIFSNPCSLFGHHSRDQRPTVILELGSGNGFLALEHLLHQLPAGSRLYLTDLESVVPLLEENIEAAHAQGRIPNGIEVQARALQWGNKEHTGPFVDGLERRHGEHPGRSNEERISHILCSDLVYFPHLLEPLLRTLLWLTAEDAAPCQPTAAGTDERIEVIIGCKSQVSPCSAQNRVWRRFDSHLG